MRTFVPHPVCVATLLLGALLLGYEKPSQAEALAMDLNPTMKYTEGWFGNSLNNIILYTKPGTPPDYYYEYVQKDGNGLAVGPDGTCYCTSGWDEAGKGLGFYKDGHAVGHCYGISSGRFTVSVDDKYVYTINFDPAKALSTIARWNLDGSPAPASNLPVIQGYIDSILAANHHVYLGSLSTGLVTVYDRDTFKVLNTFPVRACFRMAADNDGKLWIVNRSADDPNKSNDYAPDNPNSTAQVTQYDPVTGKPTGKNITGMTGATAVAVTPDNTLLVAGPNTQVLEFNISGAQPVQTGTLGVKGGVYSDPAGTMGPDRLFGLWGIGCDKAGNIYTLGRLANAALGFDLRSFTRDGRKMKWQLYNVDFTGIAGADPASDGLDVYTTATHFHLDPSKQPGQQANWVGYTVDPLHYDDMRAYIGDANSPMMRRLRGRLYMFMHPGPYLGIFRKGPAETFIPSGMLDFAPPWLQMPETWGDHAHDIDWPPPQPLVPSPWAKPTENHPMAKTTWQWRDENGDGKIQNSELKILPGGQSVFGALNCSWVDMKGDVWLATEHNKIVHLPLQGFDAHQNPIYDWSKQILPAAPPELPDISRLQYDSDHDVMYLTGNPPNTKEQIPSGSIGAVVIRYDNWSTKPTVRWALKVPEQNPGDGWFPAFYVAGDRLFLQQRWMSCVYVFNIKDATYVGKITTTKESGLAGWCDQMYGIQAFARKDGCYFVFHEDDYRPKIRFENVPAEQPPAPSPMPW